MAPGEFRMQRFNPAPAAAAVRGRGLSFPHLALNFNVVFLLAFCVLVNGCATSVQAPVVSKDSKIRNRASVSGGQSAAADVQAAGGYHRVRRGDTLYSIAFRYGLDYRELAEWNAISRPYVIYPGQTIRLEPQSGGARRHKPVPKQAERSSGATVARSKQSESAVKRRTIKWQWPTSGSLLDSDSPISRKGVDVTGKSGQPIKAAAGGDVVYSGSGLLGYGKLIIIKHNDTFLSAYAHNDRIYVKEGDRVVGGQKIATMGIGKNGEPVLHFEIRKNGKPVDPLDHLPKQRS